MLALPNTPRVGMLIMMIAMLIAPGMDVFSKLLTQTLSPGLVTFGRFAAQTILMLPLVLLAGQLVRPERGHLLAGFFLAIALLTINAALQVMPILNAIAIFFVEPLILTVLSAIFLGEKIGWRRVVAVLIGLLGAMIVIRPNWEAFGPSAILPLGTAISFACYMLVTKSMAAGRNKLALQFWTGVVAGAILAVAVVIGGNVQIGFLAPSIPNKYEITLFFCTGVLAVISHQMIVHALARVDASAAAPMQYIEVVSATLFGWWIFGDFADALTWTGAAIIICSGLYVFHRERQAGAG
ncbi:MAG: DMT family transporter [Pseudomonadota bacterium]